MSALSTVISRLATARTVAEFRSAFMRHAGELVPSGALGLYFLDRTGRPSTTDVRGVPDSVTTRYEEIGRAMDPLLEPMVTDLTAVSAVDLLGERGWHASALYDHVSGPAGLEHSVVAPLLGEGRIVGTVAFMRGAEHAAFTAADVRHTAALTHHCSALLARLSTLEADPLSLTDRDREIVALVARGLTNPEIGAALHISPNTVKQTLKRIFTRTGVRSRAELAARAGHPKR
ncbi:helix-turn-helix transcriptional regulator [Pseudonocardia pini]|uniref:helix-turn-helix transcriptional regulator n=1 Tax=Pseudonocardia pini TaxID=2758030 RepID=UPI0015F07862|nr:helix-turn-helix transcriptional regulator [Pseudonocardia pini]